MNHLFESKKVFQTNNFLWIIKSSSGCRDAGWINISKEISYTVNLTGISVHSEKIFDWMKENNLFKRLFWFKLENYLNSIKFV